MSDCISDEIWDRLFSVKIQDVPFDVMEELIEKCRHSIDIEKELIHFFQEMLDDEEELWGEEFYWVMIVLAQAGSLKSIPLFLQCLTQYPDYDNVLEMAEQCLIWLGEPVIPMLKDWLKEERTFSEKLGAAGILEAVLDYGDEALILEVKEWLKVLIKKEEEILDNGEECLGQYLMVLAFFSGEDVLPFVRSVVGRYDYCEDLNDVFEVAEGRSWLERERTYHCEWKTFAQRYAKYGGDEEKEEKYRQNIKKLLKNLEEEEERGNWENVIPLGKELRNINAEASFPSLCVAYLNLEMKNEFLEVIKEALAIAYNKWKIMPREMDYKNDIEVYKVFKGTASFTSKEDSVFLVLRFKEYMTAILKLLGYVEYELAMSKIKEMIFYPDIISDGMVRDFFEMNQDIFVLKGSYIALKSIEDLDVLIEEREKRGFEPVFPKSLTEVQIINESRQYDLYSREEKALDQEIRIFTLGNWNLELFRQELIKDIVGKKHQDLLIEKMQCYFQNFSLLIDCVYKAWNISPRWELGGRTPQDVFELNEKKHLKHKKVKIGRNDKCPCGSGKKYKKCCMN